MKTLLLLSAAFAIGASTLRANEYNPPLFSYPQTPDGEKSGARASDLIKKITTDFSWSMNAGFVSVYIPPKYKENARKALEAVIRKEHLEIRLVSELEP